MLCSFVGDFIYSHHIRKNDLLNGNNNGAEFSLLVQSYQHLCYSESCTVGGLLGLESNVREFETHWRHCAVSLSKTLYSPTFAHIR